MTNRRAMQLIWLSLAAALAARTILPSLFGLLDNDGVNLLVAARHQTDGGGWSMTATLPIYLISVLFRLLGVKLWAARLISAAAGVGVMLVLLQEGEEDGNRTTGLFAAALFAAAPIAVFFGVSELPYSLLTFLGAFGVWTLARAVMRDEPWLGAVAGLAWGAAFLCKTFAAVFAFPAAALLLQNPWSTAARNHRRWTAPALAMGAWAIIVGAAVVWRWPQYHWSVFNDYATDWRFDLAVTVWHARWEDLVSLHSLAIPLFAPGLLLAAMRRDKTPLEQLNWLFLAAVFGVYLLNPVNHFPRVLLPALPAAAWFAGRELARAVEQRAAGVAAGWAFLATALLALRIWRPAWHLDARPWLALVEIAVAGLVLAAVAAAWPRRLASWAEAAGAVTVAAATAFGLFAGYSDLDRVERLYMAHVEAVKYSGATNGVLNCGDFIRLVVRGRNDYPNFLDLPRERLVQIYRDGLPAMMRAMRLDAAVEDRRDSEGMLAMLAPIAAEAGAAVQPLDPFPRLAADPDLSRTFDNGLFAVYRLAGAVPYDSDTWPDWSLVEPALDRTGWGVIHPAEARLHAATRPDALTPQASASERRILFDLTDRPDSAGLYDVRLTARDKIGAVLWEKSFRRQLPRTRGAPGVPFAQFAVSRAREAEPNDEVIADNLPGIERIEARVTPVRGGPALWTFVRTPAWW